MSQKIFQRILAVAIVVLFASLTLLMGVVYDYFFDEYTKELKQEADFIARGISFAGTDYFYDLNNMSRTNRITWIAADGTVLYDTEADVSDMENHLDREEVKEALQNGTGESTRNSDTLAERTVYYAMKLSDGTILRLSGTHFSVWNLLSEILWPVVGVLVIAILLSAFLAARLAKQVVKPLDRIDFDHPEEVDTYEELTPLLRRLSNQDKQIQGQEEEIRRKQQEFVTITENMSEGFLMVDYHTEILSYNSSAKRILGIGDGIERQNALALNRSESFRKALELALAGQHNEQNMSLDERLYQLFADPVREGDKVVGAVILILDITDSEAREQLRREFTANVSHELKTPLTSISGFAEIIQNGIARQEDVQRFAGNIYEESQRLLRLVEDIMHLSRLDESGVSIEQETVDLLPIVKHAVERLKPLAEQKNVTLHWQGDSAVINGIPTILHEIVSNLCVNAIKYNRDGGAVWVSLEQRAQQVVLTVKDTGIGISAADQERIFERFYRVDKSHSKEIGGTGLGLSLVKHGASLHNATVTLESELGKGSTFCVHFPKI